MLSDFSRVSSDSNAFALQSCPLLNYVIFALIPS
jgi:hypothetical protein